MHRPENPLGDTCSGDRACFGDRRHITGTLERLSLYRMGDAMRKRSPSATASMLVVVLCLVRLDSMAFRVDAANQVVREEDYKALPKPGEKVALGADHYFVYGFDKAPRLGTAVMRLEIFTRDGRRDTIFVVKGDVDMPSMRTAHKTGNKEFSLSAKGVYLLPVPLVMPGDWEIRFTFEKSGKTVLLGAYRFKL